MLIVGVPKEIKALEKRVGLTPNAVKQLTEKGSRVLVQQAAGLASGFSDDIYERSGAKIVASAADLYAQSELIVKVKEPLESEYGFISSKHTLFCYLHLASPDNCALVETLVRSGGIAIGYETVELGGRFPLLAPMSEIAGALAAAYACALKTSGFLAASRIDSASAFSLLEHVASSFPNFSMSSSIGKVLIFGGGVAGFKAMEIAVKLHGEVSVVENSIERREFLRRFISSVHSPNDLPQQVLDQADILIGCVHSRGARAARVISDKAFAEASRKHNKVIIDISIDQGGNFPESGVTTYPDPVYFDSYRNLRFGVPNMPSLCGKAASEALSQVVLPYVIELAGGIEKACLRFPELQSGINIQSGKILLEAVRLAHRRSVE